MGLCSPRGCSLVPLPKRLQHADPLIVNELAERARCGMFPTNNSNEVKNKCPPLSYKVSGEHCLRPIHKQEAPKIRRLPCSAEYHYIYKSRPNGKLEWVLVVGIGTHEHTWSFKRTSNTKIKRHVIALVSESHYLRCKDISQNVEKKFGVKVPVESMQKIIQACKNTHGRKNCSLDSVLSLCQDSVLFDFSDYIISISDQRNLDISKNERDQVGISIILCNEQFLKKSVQRPRFGCD